jgi:membrane protease subunit HflK
VATKEVLQKLMNLYESGLKITEVKLQVVDAPDEVKDAFHDVVRAREEREQKINKALGYREDRIPRARGEAQKIIRAAEAYKQERVLRSQGEATRFVAILLEYKKAQGVTRDRLHLETMERILGGVSKKVFIDKDVAKNALPFLPLTGSGAFPGAPEGGK